MVLTFLEVTIDSPAIDGFKHETWGTMSATKFTTSERRKLENPKSPNMISWGCNWKNSRAIPRGGKRFIIGSSQTWHWDKLENT